MRCETLAVHAGFVCDPVTKAVAPPIYQNVAYEFDSAEYWAALFDLEEPGFRHSRIANPMVDILERRVEALEGGVAVLRVASGQAALHHALLTLADGGGSIVAPPQFYGPATPCSRIRCAGMASKHALRLAIIRATSQSVSTHRPRPYFVKAWEIQPAAFAILRHTPKSHMPTARRSSSTTRSLRRSCCGHSSTGPIL